MTELIRKLSRDHRLTETEYETLLRNRTPALAMELARLADRTRREHYGMKVGIRGAVEISSICKNDCLYCPQRRSNPGCDRYRLRMREVLDCCEEGIALGLQSFLLRGGEDAFYNDEMLESLLGKLRQKSPGCAVNLALGERSRDSYERLFNAGADRYLLRHEAADRSLYESLHPRDMSYERRLHCLNDLKDIGYQTGCGFIVGLPGQTEAHLARDLKYMEEFQPHMVDVGPFRPYTGTPFADHPAGDPELTGYLLSIIRLILPEVLLSVPGELETSVLAGANVVLYPLYPNIPTGETLAALQQRLSDIGYEADTGRGDWQGTE